MFDSDVTLHTSNFHQITTITIIIFTLCIFALPQI